MPAKEAPPGYRCPGCTKLHQRAPRYFCGCCWTRIREAQDRAAAIVTEWEEQANGA